jgi:hypothetical protein
MAWEGIYNKSDKGVQFSLISGEGRLFLFNLNFHTLTKEIQPCDFQKATMFWAQATEAIQPNRAFAPSAALTATGGVKPGSPAWWAGNYSIQEALALLPLAPTTPLT